MKVIFWSYSLLGQDQKGATLKVLWRSFLLPSWLASPRHGTNKPVWSGCEKGQGWLLPPRSGKPSKKVWTSAFVRNRRSYVQAKREIAETPNCFKSSVSALSFRGKTLLLAFRCRNESREERTCVWAFGAFTHPLLDVDLKNLTKIESNSKETSKPFSTSVSLSSMNTWIYPCRPCS